MADASSNDITADTPGDAALIVATRNGDTTAFGLLYERHVGAARRLARVLARDRAEAEDLVSETFAKLLAALRDGKGPQLAFRAYLLTTLRNTFFDRTRRDRRVEFTDDMSQWDSGEAFEDPAVADQDRSYAARAFKRLPERWQVVLWHTEVEGETAAQLAPLLGLTPNAVAALAYRARERLRQMYLQEHISDAPPSCEWTTQRLGALVRNGLSKRDNEKVHRHLAECAACTVLYTDLSEVASGFRGILAPVVLGLAAPAYLAGSAAKSGLVAVWFGGVTEWGRNCGLALADRVRRVGQKLGPRGSAAMGGAAAVVAAIVVLVLVANNTPPTPPVVADSPVEPTDTVDDPPADEPDEDPADDPGDETADEPDADEPDEDPPAEYDIGTDVSGSGLISGSNGTLPIELRSDADITANLPHSDRTEHAVVPMIATADDSVRAARAKNDDMELTVRLATGMHAVAGDPGDGWTCEPDGSTAQCRRAALSPGESTMVNIAVAVDATVTGFQDVKVSVTRAGTTHDRTLRVPVAPAGTEVGFASLDATGLAAAGNTLLTCELQLLCHNDFTDNHFTLMGPYLPRDVPGSLGRHIAASGARLEIPGGARVLWAGLHWAGSAGRSPTGGKLSIGGGGWVDVVEQAHWSGWNRPVEQSMVDITAMVDGSADIWFAVDDHDVPQGIGEYAGWGVTVVYQHAGDPVRETAVYHGLAQPDRNDGLSVAVPVGGDIDVAYLLWDGDHGLTGDHLDIGGPGGGTIDNIGRSRSPSALEGSGWNTLGVDVDVCHATGEPQPGEVSLYTGQDPMDIAVLAVSAPGP